MKPIQTVAALTAAAFFAGPLSGTASASAVSTLPARGHLTAAQFAAEYAKRLPFAGYPRASQPVSLMFHLPLRNKAQAMALAAALANPRSASYHQWLSRPEFDQRFGPLKSDLNATAAALRAGGFTVTRIDSQFVSATAPVATVERFFNTRLGLVSDAGVLKIDARTGVTMPAALQRVGAQVIGLKATVRPKPDFALAGRSLSRGTKFKAQPAAIFGPLGPYYEGELYQAYGQPSLSYANGRGETIAVVGFSDSTDSENQVLWCTYGLGPSCGTGGTTLAPYPVVNHHDFTGYIPPDTNGDSLEASLDAQMAGGSAPGATIDQYGANPSDNFMDAFSYITTTNVDDIITTSYSQCELDYIDGGAPFSTLQALDDLFVQGNAQGQTWMFSTGDSGAYACLGDGESYAGDVATSSLSSDPNVTAVGGTTALTTTYFDDGYGTGYAAETSYSDPNFMGGWASGGGVSQLFVTPFYQVDTGLPPGTTSTTHGAPYGTGRQTPDVSMQMGGPASGPFSAVWVNSGLYSSFQALIGTSAASPELAGWTAMILSAGNAATGNRVGPRLGSANELFYALEYYGYSSSAFNQYIPGDNLLTQYRPSRANPAGYNQVIGLGTPNTYNILKAVSDGGSYVPAGDIFTASNP